MNEVSVLNSDNPKALTHVKRYVTNPVITKNGFQFLAYFMNVIKLLKENLIANQGRLIQRRQDKKLTMGLLTEEDILEEDDWMQRILLEDIVTNTVDLDASPIQVDQDIIELFAQDNDETNLPQKKSDNRH